MKRIKRIDLLRKLLLGFSALVLAACRIMELLTPNPTIDPTAIPSPTTQAELVVDVSEQIIAAIISKNNQALEGYMANTVQVRLEASGCCGPLTKSEAISQLSYLNPAVGWSFDPANQTIINLATSIPDYYGIDWIVGVASNEYVVSFKLDNQNKVEAYNLAATYKLLIP